MTAKTILPSSLYTQALQALKSKDHVRFEELKKQVSKEESEKLNFEMLRAIALGKY